MSRRQSTYQLILEINKLKQVFRHTVTSKDRQESTAEHSWSASMIALILMNDLKNEFGDIDEFKIIKLILIHDIVEIYAGDVIAFDHQARKEKEKHESLALKKLIDFQPIFGSMLSSLWHEFESKQTIEAKIAKAADAICPVFQRVHANQSYQNDNIYIEMLDKVKLPHLSFSESFYKLYKKLKCDLIKKQLITNQPIE